MNVRSDEELMSAAGQGDLDAFEQIVLRHQAEAWRVAYRFTGDAAAMVLAQHDEALGCREMVNRAIESGLWTPRAGKTPANTLNAAIAREIATKGDDARFRKAERGKFTLA